MQKKTCHAYVRPSGSDAGSCQETTHTPCGHAMNMLYSMTSSQRNCLCNNQVPGNRRVHGHNSTDASTHGQHIDLTNKASLLISAANGVVLTRCGRPDKHNHKWSRHNAYNAQPLNWWDRHGQHCRHICGPGPLDNQTGEKQTPSRGMQPAQTACCSVTPAGHVHSTAVIDQSRQACWKEKAKLQFRGHDHQSTCKQH
jgi:hypothetical protein